MFPETVEKERTHNLEKNYEVIQTASEEIDQLREKAAKNWDSVIEIRKWRDTRR